MNTETGRARGENKIATLKRHLFIIALLFAAGYATAGAIYLAVPKYYLASASILQPPDSGSGDAARGSRISEALGTQMRTNTELFFSILNSRRMKDDLIRTYRLDRSYRERNMDEVREVLAKRMTVALTKNKVIDIQIIDTRPVQAAEMALFCVQNLEALTKEMTITEAKQNRIFVEDRLRETTETIGALEARLTRIQTGSRLVADKEMAQITQTAGRLMEQLLAKQLDLEKKKQILHDRDPEIVMLKNEISGIQAALSKLLSSQDELTRILRELKVQESLYSLLTTKLEEAKISETRDTPIVQILDRPAIPDKVHSPNLKLIMILVTVVIGAIGVLVIFFDVLRFLGSI